MNLIIVQNVSIQVKTQMNLNMIIMIMIMKNLTNNFQIKNTIL